MWPYWILYSIPSLLVLYALARRIELTLLFWIFIALFYAFFIGFRYEVGGDWFTYLDHYDRTIGMTLVEGLASGRDLGYAFINWLMAKWGLGVYGVNLVCGAIFVTGLIMYCRQQLNPLLAFAVAVPYLIVVVAMGYTRQGVALGLLFWAIAYLDQGKLWQYVALIAVGALFHKSVLIMLPLGVFLYGKGRVIKAGTVLLALYGLWDLLLVESQEALWRNYVDAQMISQGAKIRVFMNVAPSLLLLIYWKMWKQDFPNPWFWLMIAGASVISLGLVDYASTAVDRIALYFSPIQLAVYSRLPYLPLLPGHGRQLDPSIPIVAIVLAYAAVLFVWLNYATHAKYWLPYQNIIFQ